MSYPKIIAKDSGGGDFKKIPPGAHFAICQMVADIGLQEGFSGKPQHKIYLRWEVPDERIEYTDKQGRHVEGPCTIGKTYTLSLSEKANLRKDLENWRGRAFTQAELEGFNIVDVIGKCCQIMVTHETKGNKTYANVTGVMGISREQKERAKSAKAENDPLVYSVAAHDQKTFEKLPEWLRKSVENRIENEPREPEVATVEHDEFSDDIPFNHAAHVNRVNNMLDEAMAYDDDMGLPYLEYVNDPRIQAILEA